MLSSPGGATQLKSDDTQLKKMIAWAGKKRDQYSNRLPLLSGKRGRRQSSAPGRN